MVTGQVSGWKVGCQCLLWHLLCSSWLLLILTAGLIWCFGEDWVPDSVGKKGIVSMLKIK